MNGKMTLTFQVNDDPKTLNCTFDNFVWFSQDDVERAVRAEVPLYDARLPFDGELPQSVATALEHLLSQHHIASTVTFLPAAPKVGMPPTEIRFSANGNLPTVGSVEFNGGPLEDALFKVQRQRLTGRAFSAAYAHAMAESDLDVIYQNHGYLRAHFADPQLNFVPGAIESEPGSVKLVFTVTPGPQFLWHGADWDGTTVYASADLNGYLGMKEGDPAAADKISEGEDAVRQAYGKKGYITVALSTTRTLDDGA
jgi:outer membrane protein assembly factor BamA